MSEVNPASLGEAGEPFDDALHRILAAAPDRAELPDWRVRQAILAHAREAVKDSEELLIAEREPSAWAPLAWLLPGRKKASGGSSGTPWRAVFATLVVGVLATLMWQREPTPGARPDSETASDEKRFEDSRKQEQASVREVAPVAPAPTSPAAVAPVAPVAPAPAKPTSPSPQEVPATRATDSAAAADAAKALGLPPVAKPVTPPPSQPANSAAPSTPQPSTDAKAQATDKLQSRLAAKEPAPSSTMRDAANAPSVAAAPAAPAVPAPPAAAARQSASALAGAPAATPAPTAEASGPRTDATPPPNFVSLSQWRQMRIANSSGDVRILTRSEAGELNLLLGSAAIMATGPQRLASMPQWRVSLERNGGVLAVLEVASTQVRWTEGASPPATGTPPPGALDALRAGLRKALESPAAVPVPVPTPVPERPARVVPSEPAAEIRAPSAPITPTVPIAPTAPAASSSPPTPLASPSAQPSVEPAPSEPAEAAPGTQ